MNLPADVPEITATELKNRMDEGDAPLLVDVREHFERRIADLPQNGQIRMPIGELMARMGELPRDGEIVIYCRSGNRSAWAVTLMLQRGYAKVFNLKGGVLAWREEVDPSLQAY
jgi:adenylyltransferase/sulfurtransferase